MISIAWHTDMLRTERSVCMGTVLVAGFEEFTFFSNLFSQYKTCSLMDRLRSFEDHPQYRLHCGPDSFLMTYLAVEREGKGNYK